MRSHRKLTAAICQVLIGLLLFAQGAFAARPCVKAGMPDAAMLMADRKDDCQEMQASATRLCAEKCGDQDKLSAHSPLLIPPVNDQPMLALPWADRAREQRASRDCDASGRGPPKSIRFCTFLI